MRTRLARTGSVFAAGGVLATFLSAGGPVLPAATATLGVVVCAPGFPGTTEEAQPTMDRFADAVVRAAGWTDASLTAAYHPTAAAGRAHLQESTSVLAVVPFSFYWMYRGELDLRPVLQVARDQGATETWSLIAHRGRITRPADLDGWELTGLPGYAPAFVRGPLLSDWGELPASLRITPATRVLAALRRAAADEEVAVLLDPAQEAALSSLPFSGDLEVVMQSPELPGFLICAVGGRLGDDRLSSVRRALLGLHKKKEGREILESMRMVRFQEIDRRELEENAGASTGAASQ